MVFCRKIVEPKLIVGDLPERQHCLSNSSGIVMDYEVELEGRFFSFSLRVEREGTSFILFKDI